ncbi:MAG: hypothetical protein IKV03_05375 [Alphaproteobacteria bacterium]|nr:hypothetical protein [Alphaproteobacteria bacterium]
MKKLILCVLSICLLMMGLSSTVLADEAGGVEAFKKIGLQADPDSNVDRSIFSKMDEGSASSLGKKK